MSESQSPHHPLVQLARAAIEAFVREHRQLDPRQAPAPIEGEPAGVFVTLHTASTHELRGCIGTIGPTEPTADARGHQQRDLGSHARLALPAGGRKRAGRPGDRRQRAPPAEAIDSTAQLDPKRYGVIVQRSGRRGLLLPDIEGVDDVETQVSIARQKAGIGPHELVKMYRFRVEKFT